MDSELKILFVMLQFKPLSKVSIPKALVKAKHYRLLNEPWQAESICKDVLNVEPENQLAILYLILAISDQFTNDDVSGQTNAKKLCARLDSEYDKKYYRGLIEERLGKAALKRNTPRAKYIAYENYRSAMNYFEEAEKAIHTDDNQDVVLRWNACMRRIQEFKLTPSQNEDQVQPFLDV